MAALSSSSQVAMVMLEATRTNESLSQRNGLEMLERVLSSGGVVIWGA